MSAIQDQCLNPGESISISPPSPYAFPSTSLMQ